MSIFDKLLIEVGDHFDIYYEKNLDNALTKFDIKLDDDLKKSDDYKNLYKDTFGTIEAS